MRILNINELSEDLKSRIEKMKEVANRADSKYYGYNVCSMIIDEKNNEFLGVNWEPANGDSTCAEVGAISNYLLSEKEPIKYVLTFGYPKHTEYRENTFCFPCGRCRQRLLDYVNEKTICYGINETATLVKECEFSELLPHSFSAANLND